MFTALVVVDYLYCLYFQPYSTSLNIFLTILVQCVPSVSCSVSRLFTQDARDWILPLPTNLVKLVRLGTGFSIVFLEVVAEVVVARNYGLELALEYHITTKHCLFLFHFSMSSPNTSNSCHGNNPNDSAFFTWKPRTLNRNTIKTLDLGIWVGWFTHRRCSSHYKCNSRRWVDDLIIALLMVPTDYHHAFMRFILRSFFIMSSLACSYALGMQSGAINDSQIKASSFKSLWTRPSEARLHNQG